MEEVAEITRNALGDLLDSPGSMWRLSFAKKRRRDYTTFFEVAQVAFGRA